MLSMLKVLVFKCYAYDKDKGNSAMPTEIVVLMCSHNVCISIWNRNARICKHILQVVYRCFFWNELWPSLKSAVCLNGLGCFTHHSHQEYWRIVFSRNARRPYKVLAHFLNTSSNSKGCMCTKLCMANRKRQNRLLRLNAFTSKWLFFGFVLTKLLVFYQIFGRLWYWVWWSMFDNIE